ncbi:MAG TPA: M36 family metallopeptidase [Kofleriaceae bacterium]|nr:M36 family metallopeptidase [Kofleriaceae bacterium]
MPPAGAGTGAALPVAPAARPPALQTAALPLDHGATWRARRDPAAGVARVASGPAIHLVAHPDPAPAELDAAARAFLDRHVAAFGAPSRQLALAAARPIGDTHAVLLYEQHRDSLPVLGARVALLFRGPALAVVSSTAEPLPRAGAFTVARDRAVGAAHGALDAAGVTPHRRVVSQRRVLVPRAGALRPAWQIMVATSAPLGRLELLLDGETGAVLRAADLVQHAVVQITADVAPAEPGGAAIRRALPRWSADASPDGRADVSGAVTVTLDGPLASVTDALAPTASHQFTASGAEGIEELVWPAGAAPAEQLDAWVWVHRAIEYGRDLAPDVPWLSRPIGVHVNFDDGSGFPYCNAFYMPQVYTDEPTREDVHFFRAGGDTTYQCVNTASLAGVVLHEWGHGLHDHLLPAGLAPTFDETERAISEGVGDYVSASMLDDPRVRVDAILAPGASVTIEPRLADNQLRYPDDLRTTQLGSADVHWNGQIWSGTFWDLRAGLRDRYGAAGVRMADDLHARVLRASPTWASAYDLAIALDDDDEDPGNGSPHSCEINAAFAAHGLAPSPRPARGSLRFSHQPAAGAPLAVTITAAPGCGDLDPATVELRYAVAGGEELALPMTGSGDSFQVEPPAEAAGQVMSYRFVARTSDGAEASWPAGGARFGLALGEGPALAMWDFEDGGAGWTHGASSPAADDWEIGAPAGVAGDPSEPAGGGSVAGTDLGRLGNGAYDGGAVTWLESPPVSCGDCSGLRLRLRRSLALGAGDVARVMVGEQVAWQATGPLRDPGWIDQEIDLPEVPAGAGEIRIRFELESDAAVEAGGWTLDDVALLSGALGGSDVTGGCSAAGSGPGPAGGAALLLGLMALARTVLRRRGAGAPRVRNR